jgi:RNA recognition motif
MSDQLFIAPCPPTWTPEEIRALFEQVGPVKQVKRPRDYETGDYRKFAFVTMTSAELAAAAVEQLNGVEIEGAPLTVRLAEKPAVSEVKTKSEAKPKPASHPTTPPEFDWEQRQEILARVLAAPGTATTAKVTVVGRPGWVEPYGNTVIVSLAHSLKPTGYPKGVPAPLDTPTTYVVFIGAKQWKKVAEAIENPEDVLIIEGQAMLDAALSSVLVFATNVNTKLLQQASRPKAENGGESSG